MPSARIIRFPRAYRRRSAPPGQLADWRLHQVASAAYGVLAIASLVRAFLYLSGVAGVARHDLLYGVLLAAVWAAFFAYEFLLDTRVLGPILMRATHLLAVAAVLLFFGFVY